MAVEDTLAVDAIIATLPPDLDEIAEMLRHDYTIEDIADELQRPLEEIDQALEQLRELFNDFAHNAY